MKKTALVALCTLAIASSSAMAGYSSSYSWTGANSSGTKTNTNAYAGLNWSLGGSWTPSLVLGVVETRVKNNGNTEGANLSFSLNVFGGFKPGKLKLSYLNGKDNLQGELGFGYDFALGAPLLGLGANAPFIGAGVDGYLNGNIVPFVVLHSQDKFKKENRTTRTCTRDATIDTSAGHYPFSDCTGSFGG